MLGAADGASKVLFAAAVRRDAEEEEAFDFLLGKEAVNLREEALGEEEPIEGFASDQVAEDDFIDFLFGDGPAADDFEKGGVPRIAGLERSTEGLDGLLWVERSLFGYADASLREGSIRGGRLEGGIGWSCRHSDASISLRVSWSVDYSGTGVKYGASDGDWVVGFDPVTDAGEFVAEKFVERGGGIGRFGDEGEAELGAGEIVAISIEVVAGEDGVFDDGSEAGFGEGTGEDAVVADGEFELAFGFILG
jgi:hypothetical protein